MSTLDPLGSFPELALSLKSSAVLVADVVESVRLAEEGEQDAIERWVRFVKLVGQDILPNTEGRLVKSTGDGFLLEFKSVPDAVYAAFKIQSLSAHENRDVPEERKEWLRIGIETGRIYVSELDVFGADVNRAARLAGLAQGGEIVVSAKARDQITISLDADIEDMGENFLKNIKEPVRAYKLHPPGKAGPERRPLSIDDMLPSIAIIPFAVWGGDDAAMAGLGDVIAEELILAMSRSRYVNIISRMSTMAFRNRADDFDAIAKHLNARFVVSGSCRISGGTILANVELTEPRSKRMIFAQRFHIPLPAILAGDNSALEAVVDAISSAIVSRELDRIRVQPMPTLETYTLLIGAVSLLHRFSQDDFFLAHKILEELTHRAPRYAASHAWLANWYTLKVQQGWTQNIREDAMRSEQMAKMALDLDPDSSLALSIRGLVSTNFKRDYAEAEKFYSQAVEKNPNDAMAWILKAAMYVVSDQGKAAISCCNTAIKLSPLDPQAYFYESALAASHFVSGDLAKAIEIGTKSFKQNRQHASTVRLLAAAHWFDGDEEKARQYLDEMFRMHPDFTVSGYRRSSPTAASKVGERMVQAFRALGVPEQ
ncbi:MAG: tetratricopeptide repeat protein [Brucellaceae bacterium]|nr:tetratricopeptide repeat protein [Brucellaceae bacterium]